MIFNYLDNVSFTQPEFFWLLLLLPLLIGWYILRRNVFWASMRVSSTAAPRLGSMKTAFRHLPFFLRCLAVTAIVFALAKPQIQNEEQQAEGEGIDIILCIDVSGSMTETDFPPNRLEAAKNVAIDFIRHRPTDRIGIVIFSDESFTQCPLTTDQSALIASVKGIHHDILRSGTAIGSGLATSVDRLRNGTSKSKVVLLLTDGENNGGLIDPGTAKEIAKTFGVRVYTIGMGADQLNDALTDIDNVELRPRTSVDEKQLDEIARETGGKYFRARDVETLGYVYRNIDALEKSKVQLITNVHRLDKFFPFVIFALCVLVLEIILTHTVFRKFP